MKRTLLLCLALTVLVVEKAKGSAREHIDRRTPRNIDAIARFDDLEVSTNLDPSPDVPPVSGLHEDDRNLFDVAPAVHEKATSLHWSHWSDWTACSRSCGGGVSSRFRFSVTEVLHAKGPSVEHELCNTEKCPEGSLGFREMQCSQQNGKLFHGRNLKWIPFSGKNGNTCELTCMAKKFNFYHSFGKALDGTKCGIRRRGVCIEQQCESLGCDGVIGSDLSEDVCGVCGGSNRTCFRYQKVVDRLPRGGSISGYNKIATIPIRATHIAATSYNGNYLALVEVEGDEERYVINGNWVVSWTGEFKAAGTIVSYSRANGEETLEIVGPTTKELRIAVLCLGRKPPLVRYEYWIANSEREKDERYAELKVQRQTIVHAPNEDDYRSRILGAGLDFDAVKPPTSAAITTTRTTVSTGLASATETAASTTTLRTRGTAKMKNGFRRPGGARHSSCVSCKRPSNKKKRFCDSDFALHARVLPRRRLRRGRLVRYEIEILHTYKSKATMPRRQHVWASSTCCPRLRPHRHFLLSGRMKVSDAAMGSAHHQARLMVDHADYWLSWKKYHVRMARIAKHANCKRYRQVAAKYHRRKHNEG